jgi:hypothetical protein
MTISILSTDPVGTPVANAAITDFINKLKNGWDVAKSQISGKVTMVQVTKYLLGALDELVKLVNSVLTNVGGADKKATVLAATAIIYDYIVVQAFPFWMKPFSGQIRNFIIYTVMSIAIDWIVSKYNNGTWTAPTPSAS